MKINASKNNSGSSLLFILFSPFVIMILLGIFLFSPDKYDPKRITIDPGYNKSMQVLLTKDNFPVNDNKAVSYVHNIGLAYSDKKGFTRFHLPEEIQASSPEEARFIVYCTHERRQVGIYGSNGAGGRAYQYVYSIEIWDRHIDKYIAKQKFEGDPPPSTNRTGNCGAPPKESAIQQWILSAIEEETGIIFEINEDNGIWWICIPIAIVYIWFARKKLLVRKKIKQQNEEEEKRRMEESAQRVLMKYLSQFPEKNRQEFFNYLKQCPALKRQEMLQKILYKYGTPEDIKLFIKYNQFDFLE